MCHIVAFGGQQYTYLVVLTRGSVPWNLSDIKTVAQQKQLMRKRELHMQQFQIIKQLQKNLKKFRRQQIP